MNINVNQVKELREVTGAGVIDCKKALVTTNGNMEKAKAYLISKFGDKADKKSDRVTNEGMIANYIHQNGKMGAMVVVKCETDFVARNEHFKQLAYDIAMQIGAMNPENVSELLCQTFIKDGSVTIKDYINQTIGKLGENIVIDAFSRFEI